MMNAVPRDATLDRAMAFAKNHRPSGGFSNLYVIKCINDDGTVVDEKYGMNLFTDIGIKRFLVDRASFPQYLYVGDGTGTIDRGSDSNGKHTLLRKIPDFVEYAKSITDTTSYAYPLYYAANYTSGTEIGLVTAVMRYKTFTFRKDQNQPAASHTDFPIYEYGIGEDIDHLWTHSFVYNSLGQQTFVNRWVADNLVFEVYLCFSYYESQITAANATGVFPIITGVQRFMNKMEVSNVHTYKRNNIKVARSVNKTSTAFVEDKVGVTYNLNEFQIINNTEDAQGYVDGFAQYYNGFTLITPESASPAEAFVSGVLANRPDQFTDVESFSKKFGVSSVTPFTKANITYVNTYDYTSDTWTMPVRFNAAASHDYCETPMQPTLSTLIYYTNNHAYIPMYVYLNTNTADDILAIRSTCETIYATDKYWDVSTWTNITNFSEIPVGCKNARYWIASSNTTQSQITTVRASGLFYVKPHAGSGDSDGYRLLPFEKIHRNHTCVAKANSTYHWYAIDNRIYIDAGTNSYTFTTGESSYSINDSDWFTYDKWAFISQGYNIKYISLYDMSNATSEQPTKNNITIPFTSSSAYVNLSFITESKTGLFCFSRGDNNEAVVIDLSGSTFDINVNSYKFQNCSIASCIDNTKKIAYVDTTTTSVKVFDYTTQTHVYSKLLPSTFGTATFIFGMGKYIWVSNSSVSYVIDTDNDTMTQCDRAINGDNKSIYCHVKTYDDVVLIYHRNDGSYASKSSLFKLSDPTTNIDISGVLGPGYNGQGSGYRFVVDILNIKYTVNNTDYRTMILLAQRSTNYDYHDLDVRRANIGKFLNHPSESYDVTDDSNDTTEQIIPCDNNHVIMDNNLMVPVENLMGIRLTGTTDTISAINNIKAFKSKSWTVEVTNVPTFGNRSNNGIIPGVRN